MVAFGLRANIASFVSCSLISNENQDLVDLDLNQVLSRR